VGEVTPWGGHDRCITLEGCARVVRFAYRKLIADWRTVLPTQSVCLRVPIAPIGGDEEARQAAPGRPDAAAVSDDSHQSENMPLG